VAFIDTIGEPVCLVGWSGIEPPLGAAAQSSAVAAVALFEGYVPPVAEPGELVALRAVIERTGAAADGRLADAARAFAPYVISDVELAALDQDFFERWGRSIPAMLRYFQQNMSHEGPGPTTPTSWRGSPHRSSRCGAPGPLIVHLSRSPHSTWPGTPPTDTSANWPAWGTLPPLVAPEFVAKELAHFFESIR
jgi:hypothetical protein